MASIVVPIGWRMKKPDRPPLGSSGGGSAPLKSDSPSLSGSSDWSWPVVDAATFRPAVRPNWPSVTTRSPPLRPLRMTVRSPMPAPRVTACIRALLSAPTSHRKVPVGLR